ncbi:GFA family protein [Parathalassolituus penaei]|uniref:GFA family protein n=1 Tax=Parathalassolituus penaei TaxID=2997323 RepID=A0A9X3EFT0_9GAMM|nr:GFA family protein [Parathalassolituus penaei]MCY0966767.1 GFA family protein [Parathalassolituus penaei]
MIKAVCHCQSVVLEIHTESLVQVHCHCKDCQRAHGAAYVSSSIYPAAAVRQICGELVEFILERTPRLRCAQCGMHMYSELSAINLRSVNAYALPDGAFQPQFHVQCQDAVHPLADQLPHYKAFPASFGGSDEMMEW